MDVIRLTAFTVTLGVTLAVTSVGLAGVCFLIYSLRPGSYLGHRTSQSFHVHRTSLYWYLNQKVMSPGSALWAISILSEDNHLRFPHPICLPATMAEVSKSLNIPQIEKLCGATNYHTRRSIATTFPDIIGLWDVVTGKTPKPDSTDATAGASWVYLSQRAKGFILFNIDRGLMPLISTAPDAPSAWAKLEKKFDRKTPTSLHSLLKCIITLRCSN